MEFLDPKAKKRHRIQLIIGYTLMGTLISIITMILVFNAYGFDVNRKTGEVIQNGLIYVDSSPDEANVAFNGVDQKSKTNNRYSLPSGNYNVTLKKDGYRTWSRDFNLSGGEVERFTYPLLIPGELKSNEVKAYSAAPGLTTESPDRRWMIIAEPGSLTNFTEYDLNSVNRNKVIPDSRQFAIPASVLTAATTGQQSLELVEWSTDNRHMLLKHTYDDKAEFIVISRDQPEASLNINTLLGVNPDKVMLKDKKFDQWFIYTAQGGILQSADAKKTVTTLFTNVTAFKSHGDDTLLYAQSVNDGKTQRINLQQGKDSYLIRDVSSSAPVQLDIARYDGAWYLIAGVDADQKSYIYKDPQTILNKKDGTKLTPLTVLKSNGPITAVSFSHNTRFILTQSGQHFEIYDAEKLDTFRFDIADIFDANTKVSWMDGHRLMARSAGKMISFDFDGSNKQALVTANVSTPILFDRDYTVIYSFDTAKSDPAKTSLFSTSLRLDADK